MDRPYLRSLAWILGGVCIILTLLSLVLSGLIGLGWSEIIEERLPVVGMLAISYATVGAFIAWHRPQNAIGWVFIGAAFFQSLNIFLEQYAHYALLTRPGTLPFGIEASWLAENIWAPGLVLLLTFLPLLFPDGRPPSPRWWPVAWLGIISTLMIVISGAIALWPLRGLPILLSIGDTGLDSTALPVRVLNLSFPLLLLSSVLALLSLSWRFRHAQGAVRAQIKWFLLAGIVTLAGFVLSELVAGWYPGLAIQFDLLGIIIIPMLPLAAAVAILRYRLYDIDVIIRKTLLYSLLTALLGLVYFGSVLLLQQLFTTFAGEQPTAAIVLSTLLIAALFTPLRRRIQRIIDRRFFRQRYDAQRVLAQFAAIARDETDVDRLTAEVIQVINETIQPMYMSIWLKDARNS